MTTRYTLARRTFVQWLPVAALGPSAALAATAARATARVPLRLADAAITIEFDDRLHCRVSRGALALTDFGPSEFVQLADGRTIRDFRASAAHVAEVDDPQGRGRQLVVQGASPEGLEKTVAVTLFDACPGFAIVEVTYRNAGTRTLAFKGWTNAAHRLKPRASAHDGFWTYAGSTHEDRRDWVQPVKAGFAQDNFMGMSASDYGGGTPIVDVWRRDAGLAVGHVETVPRLVSLPVKAAAGGGVDLALACAHATALEPGASTATLATFVAVHRGDYFATLDTYRRFMAVRGIAAPQPPAESYEPIWCAWGYEREFSLERVRATLPKVRELGLDWAVLDDGWQTLTGDWNVDTGKFPRGEADMKALVDDIKAHGLKPRLWLAPLAVAPGSDQLHDHADMLLLDKDGAVQNVSWWNSFYLCPAYGRTLDRTREIVRRIMGEWGFEGLKIDGQHLNGVAPCFNPAHHHARPEESVEQVQNFHRVIYDTARELNPRAVVEVCPCGTAYAFHNMPFMNQTPASDPESSWQVRHKGKTLKALMGRSWAYAGDHVELSDHGDDFASTVGVGGVVSTKFTWPVDPKPKDSFLLTPEREAAWRRWVGVYRTQRLAQGRYLGELYDIGFDKPETHVVEKAGRLYFAFYAEDWHGPVEFRGLGQGTYALRDYVEDRSLGTVSATAPVKTLAFRKHLLLEARPV
jgi:alpha-galactosidase